MSKLLQSSTAETRMSSLYLTSNIWGFSNLSRFPPLKAKWIFYFREIPRRYFITFLFHSYFTGTNEEIFYFIFISSIRIEWRNILSHFYFILSSPGTNDEIFYHIFISFLFHPEQMTKYFISFLFHQSGSNDEIFYHIFISFLVHPERMTKYFIS